MLCVSFQAFTAVGLVSTRAKTAGGMPTLVLTSGTSVRGYSAADVSVGATRGTLPQKLTRRRGPPTGRRLNGTDCRLYRTVPPINVSMVDRSVGGNFRNKSKGLHLTENENCVAGYPVVRVSTRSVSSRSLLLRSLLSRFRSHAPPNYHSSSCWASCGGPPQSWCHSTREYRSCPSNSSFRSFDTVLHRSLVFCL